MKEKIKKRFHNKASEVYVEVNWNYGDYEVNWDIPIEYRRTGTFYQEKTDDEIKEYLLTVKNACNPKNWDSWKKEQNVFWSTKPKASITKEFFDVLSKDFTWKSVSTDLPSNPNWARRIQDLKEFGYTLATKTKITNGKNGDSSTQILLIPLPKGGVNGYEKWSKELRSRILGVLGYYDQFEAKKSPKEGLLPDHKFPEIRWDNKTKREDIEMLSDDEIRKDFQLMSNQRNLQKREVCRSCYQTSIRGKLYGIDYFYEGSELWNEKIPKVGKEAEQGCIGCPWYDIKEWRESLNCLLKKNIKS